MTDRNDDVSQLPDAYGEEAPAPPSDRDVPDAFGYLHYKAFAYLKLGPDAYREVDALSQPRAGLPATKLDALAKGCEQILHYRGLSPDEPLEGVGVSGFYDLLRLFHFEAVMQRLAASDGDAMLDEMHMRHMVDGREIVLYNRVANPLTKQPGPPCPHCGTPLRTARARQCRACGRRWHKE